MRAYISCADQGIFATGGGGGGGGRGLTVRNRSDNVFVSFFKSSTYFTVLKEGVKWLFQ